jgi:hypothetical protein
VTPTTLQTRFDLILAVIGASLVSGGLAGLLPSIPMYLSAATGSAVGGVAALDGLVRNPPTE